MVKIEIKYSSNIYDEILGIIKEDSKNYKKDQYVIAIIDYDNYKIKNNE